MKRILSYKRGYNFLFGPNTTERFSEMFFLQGYRESAHNALVLVEGGNSNVNICRVDLIYGTLFSG